MAVETNLDNASFVEANFFLQGVCLKLVFIQNGGYQDQEIQLSKQVYRPIFWLRSKYQPFSLSFQGVLIKHSLTIFWRSQWTCTTNFAPFPKMCTHTNACAHKYQKFRKRLLLPPKKPGPTHRTVFLFHQTLQLGQSWVQKHFIQLLLRDFLRVTTTASHNP